MHSKHSKWQLLHSNPAQDEHMWDGMDRGKSLQLLLDKHCLVFGQPSYLFVDRKQQFYVFLMHSRWRFTMITKHKIHALQPEMDGDKLIELCWDNCFFDLYKLIVDSKQQFDHSCSGGWRYCISCAYYVNFYWSHLFFQITCVFCIFTIRYCGFCIVCPFLLIIGIFLANDLHILHVYSTILHFFCILCQILLFIGNLLANYLRILHI